MSIHSQIRTCQLEKRDTMRRFDRAVHDPVRAKLRDEWNNWDEHEQRLRAQLPGARR